MRAEKPIKPALNRYALSEIETALEPLEKSWVNFLYGVRTRRRHIRSKRFPSHSIGKSYGATHRILESYREQVIDGNRHAIWMALIFCIEENVPLPYWVGDAILDIHETVNQEPSSLHDLFGFESRLPAEGKRALATRAELQWRWRLSSAVNALMVKPEPGMSKDAAIKKVRDDLHVPYSQRKCREMFDKQERIERADDDAWKGRKTHHAR